MLCLVCFVVPFVDEVKKKIVNCFFTHEALRVHMNSFKRVRAFQIEPEFGSVGF